MGAAALAEVASHCYYVSQGWWGYELCPGHHLGQFHATEGAPRIESALSLGRYDAEQVLLATSPWWLPQCRAAETA